MAVISTGLVPKGLAGGSGSFSAGSAAVGRQRVARQPKTGGLLRAIKKAARYQLAGHNCGGAAHHDGSGMAYPIGRR
jgi:hypothetical protein